MVCNSSCNRGNVGANPSIRRTATGKPVAVRLMSNGCARYGTELGAKRGRCCIVDMGVSGGHPMFPPSSILECDFFP